MRSRNRNVEVMVRGSDVPIPLFVEMGHRHLEKEMPVLGGTTFTIPVDLLSLCVPADLVGEVEEIELGYKKA